MAIVFKKKLKEPIKIIINTEGMNDILKQVDCAIKELATTPTTVLGTVEDDFDFSHPGNTISPPTKKPTLGIGATQSNSVTYSEKDVWLAKSAIQKAYRRGDTNLFEHAFHVIRNSKEAEWLLRRAVILPAEENWPRLYEIGRLMNLKVNPLWSKKEYEEALFLLHNDLYKQCLYEKDKTADGIRATADYLAHADTKFVNEFLGAIDPKVSQLELSLLDQMIDIEKSFAQGAKSLSNDMWQEIWRAVDEISPKGSEDPQLLLRDQVGACYFRSKYGAMPSDKTLLACVSLLSIDAWKFGVNGGFPQSVNVLTPQNDFIPGSVWPWYIADMHTLPGKAAMYKAATKFKVDSRIIQALWFYEESAKTNTKHVSQWWEIAKTCSYLSKGYSMYAALQLWDDVRPFIKKTVESSLHL